MTNIKCDYTKIKYVLPLEVEDALTKDIEKAFLFEESLKTDFEKSFWLEIRDTRPLPTTVIIPMVDKIISKGNYDDFTTFLIMDDHYNKLDYIRVLGWKEVQTQIYYNEEEHRPSGYDAILFQNDFQDQMEDIVLNDRAKWGDSKIVYGIVHQSIKKSDKDLDCIDVEVNGGELIYGGYVKVCGWVENK